MCITQTLLSIAQNMHVFRQNTQKRGEGPLTFHKIAMRSPKGGRPLRTWQQTNIKGEPNVDVAGDLVPVIDDNSTYCVRVGYLEDGSWALIPDHQAFYLYKLLDRSYGQKQGV